MFCDLIYMPVTPCHIHDIKLNGEILYSRQREVAFKTTKSGIQKQETDISNVKPNVVFIYIYILSVYNFV